VLTLVALAAYPAGAILRLAAPETAAGEMIALIGGFGLILLALIAAAMVMGSRLQRIVGEEAKQLDEMEMHLRHKALSWSYAVLSVVLMLALFYAGVATDGGWWLPSTYDHWSGIFWGAFPTSRSFRRHSSPGRSILPMTMTAEEAGRFCRAAPAPF